MRSETLSFVDEGGRGATAKGRGGEGGGGDGVGRGGGSEDI